MLQLRYGIYLIILSMPLYLWRFSVAGIPVNFLEMMIYVLFLFWLFNRIKKRKFYPALAEGFCNFSYMPKNNLIFLLGIVLLFLGVTISTIYSSDLRTSLGIFKGWFVSPLLFFVVLVNVFNKKEYITNSLKSYLASGVVVSLIGIIYLLNGKITFDGRLSAFFLSPNHLAMYLAPAFLTAIASILSLGISKKRSFCHSREDGNPGLISKNIFEKCSFVSLFEFTIKKNKKLLYLIILLIISVPLCSTYSYGAFLGIFAGTLYLVAKSGRLNTKSACFKSFVLLFFFGLVAVSFVKFEQIASSEHRSSFHSRLMIWNSAKEIAKDNFFLGIGPGTFQETYLAYSQKFSKPYLEWAVPQPHNIFFAFYLQTGLIGFLGFILILSWFFRQRDIILSHLSDEQVFPTEKFYIINALMMYILIHGLVDTTYWKNDLALIFWIILGLKFVSQKQFDPQNTGRLSANKIIDKDID